MKIGVISDLHIDNNKGALKPFETFSKLLSEVLIERKVNLLLLAGDVSNHYEVTQEFIEDVQDKSGIPILFVPGNHDYWAMEHGVEDTNKIHDFFARQDESLIANPRILNDEWAVVGTPGWYDYGYGNASVYTEEEFSRKRYKFAYWNDARYIDWGRSDKMVSKEMLKQVEKDLEQMADRKIILMTHVATHPNFVVPLPHRLYDFANAYLGAKSYEQLYREHHRIKYSVMGHVHFRKSVKEFGKTFISSCLGNQKHWVYKENAKQELNQCLKTFEI